MFMVLHQDVYNYDDLLLQYLDETDFRVLR